MRMAYLRMNVIVISILKNKTKIKEVRREKIYRRLMDLCINLNSRGQYLTNLSRAQTEWQDKGIVINSIFCDRGAGPGKNGGRGPSITYFWLAGD